MSLVLIFVACVSLESEPEGNVPFEDVAEMAAPTPRTPPQPEVQKPSPAPTPEPAGPAPEPVVMDVDGETFASLTNLDEVGKLGRALLHKGPDGSYQGYKLTGIRKDSPLAKLGVENSDVILEANGIALTSVTAALEAYNQLQDAKTVTIRGERKGRPMTWTYNIGK